MSRPFAANRRIAVPGFLSLVALIILGVGEATAQIDPLDITGRDFAGIEFGGEVSGVLEIAGASAAVWREPRDAPPGESTQRLLLKGDVVVRLGVYTFDAAQAVLWLSRQGQGWQVAAYFDRVREPEGEPGVSQSADRLLVTGTLTGADPVLRVDARTEGRPRDQFLVEGERRLAAHLLSLIGAANYPEVRPQAVEPLDPLIPGLSRPFDPDSPYAPLPREAVARVPSAERLPPVFAKTGIFTFAGEPIRIDREETGTIVTITGGALWQYRDLDKSRSLQLTAERLVAFVSKDADLTQGRLDADDVEGIYLEGNVIATDGSYTLRGPKVYYDAQAGTATVLDAVFSAYDARRRSPLYIRAKTLRQEASNKFSASGVKLSSAAFFEPQFSLGTSDVTITREPTPDGERKTIVEADDLSIRALGLPLFYWPRFEGDIENMPLRDFSIENASGSGTIIRTAWDVFGLLGERPPEGIDLDLLLEGHFERGPAIGLAAGINKDNQSGSLFTYALPNDTGTDHTTSGARIDDDDTFRGMAIGEYRLTLNPYWTLFLEGSYISDERFVDVFFEDLAETRREFTNSAYLRYVNDEIAFTIEAQGTFNDFTPNEYLLQSLGYQTQRVPEATFRINGLDLLKDSAPGLVNYTSESRFGRLSLALTEPTAEQLGFNRPGRSREAFGIEPDETIADTLRARGIDERNILRADSRHELSLDIHAGPIQINPFVVGRITAYDTGFDEFSPDDNDRTRLYGAAGVRVATSIHRIDNDVSSRLFDLHRIRHIIEPSITAWASGANLDQNDLPIYDDHVESLATGSAVRIGVDHTFQTQRGGPGRWRSVDVLRLSNHIVFSSQDTDDGSTIKRFYDPRPEYSQLGGDFMTSDISWQVTDAVALSLHNVYDLETTQNSMTSFGGIVRHADLFDAYIELRYINPRDVTFLLYGGNYQLTPKYRLGAFGTYDTDRNEFQSIGASLRRRFPETTVGITINYNQISDQTRFGVIFEPAGLSDRTVRLRQLSRNARGSSAAIGG